MRVKRPKCFGLEISDERDEPIDAGSQDRTQPETGRYLPGENEPGCQFHFED
jgi:hypothetical protein